MGLFLCFAFGVWRFALRHLYLIAFRKTLMHTRGSYCYRSHISQTAPSAFPTESPSVPSPLGHVDQSYTLLPTADAPPDFRVFPNTPQPSRPPEECIGRCLPCPIMANVIRAREQERLGFESQFARLLLAVLPLFISNLRCFDHIPHAHYSTADEHDLKNLRSSIHFEIRILHVTMGRADAAFTDDAFVQCADVLKDLLDLLESLLRPNTVSYLTSLLVSSRARKPLNSSPLTSRQVCLDVLRGFDIIDPSQVLTGSSLRTHPGRKRSKSGFLD